MRNQLPINSAEDALKIGQIIARSGMFACPNDENGAAIALFCYQDGISLFEFQRCFHLLDGKPTMKVDAMLAKLLEIGGSYEIISRTDKIASIRVNRKDGPQYDFAVTYDEVVASGVALKSNGTLKEQYRIRPKNMIWARVASDAIRTVEPRVNAGLYTTEEMEDAQEDGGATTTPNVALPELVAPINYSVIPEGLPGAGDSWLGRSHEFLTAVLANPASLTEEHLESVQSALDRTPF
jgi:hypothetical protein